VAIGPATGAPPLCQPEAAALGSQRWERGEGSRIVFQDKIR
jgi:hypothetical protein